MIYNAREFVVVVQSLSFVQLFVTLWTAVCQASLSFTISWSLLKLTCIESMMPSNHPLSVTPFSSCPQSFPASGSFPMSQLFKWPKYWSFSFHITALYCLLNPASCQQNCVSLHPRFFLSPSAWSPLKTLPAAAAMETN